MILRNILTSTIKRFFGLRTVKQFTNSSKQNRRLIMEPLESRELLSVSIAEYDQIRSSYSSLKLPQYEEMNCVEVSACDSDNLRTCLENLDTSEKPALVLLRGDTDNATYVDLENDTLSVEVTGNRTITIVGQAESDIRFVASQTNPLFSIKSGHVNFVNLGFTNLTVEEDLLSPTILLSVYNLEDTRGNQTVSGLDLDFYDTKDVVVNSPAVSISSQMQLEAMTTNSIRDGVVSNATQDSNYAVIFSGGGVADRNYSRYYENVKELYNVLRTDHQLPAELN